MASTYSTNLALELIGTGDQSGTWGTTTNTNLGTLIEQSISGYVTQAITDGADTTITIPNGASGVARNMYIEMTGALTAARNLIVPANKKLYFVYNNTTGGYAVTVKVSGQTGVSVPNGAKIVLVSNGTDIVSATNYVASLTVGSITLSSALGAASGGTGVSSYTVGDLLYASGATTLSKLADVATGNALISGGVGVAPSWGKVGLTTHITGTLAVANGGTGLTAPGDSGNVLTSDGTEWTSSALPAVITIPTGVMFDYAGSGTVPTGYLLCDGSAVSRTTYAPLFAVVGTTWGAGNGSTTFNLPDTRRRVSVGNGGTGTSTLANTVGATGGAETHTLNTSEIPAHTHSYLTLSGYGSLGFISDTNGFNSETTGSTGGGSAHNNMQPSYVVQKIIKT
jgi:microcystin-dependent protein